HPAQSPASTKNLSRQKLKDITTRSRRHRKSLRNIWMMKSTKSLLHQETTGTTEGTTRSLRESAAAAAEAASVMNIPATTTPTLHVPALAAATDPPAPVDETGTGGTPRRTTMTMTLR